MLNFIFLFMYALAGACAAIDTETLNAQQSLVRFAQVDTPSSHTLKINSLKDDSALLALKSHKDTSQFHTGIPHTLTIARKGATYPLARVLTELTPSDKDYTYTCKVSVESFDTGSRKNYAEESFVTRSNDLECINLPKIDTLKVFGNRIRAQVAYTLPSDTNGTAYCLFVSVCLSDPEVVSIALNKCSDYLLGKNVFVLTYDKGQTIPRKVQL